MTSYHWMLLNLTHWAFNTPDLCPQSVLKAAIFLKTHFLNKKITTSQFPPQHHSTAQVSGVFPQSVVFCFFFVTAEKINEFKNALL